MKKLLSLIVLSLLMMTGLAWAQTYLIEENIQDWTARGSYGTYSQEISVDGVPEKRKVSMTQCIIQPGAAAAGDVCSAGRIQMQAENGIVELPELPSIGTATFNIVAGGVGRSIILQKKNGDSWEDLVTFSNIGTTGATYSYDVNVNSLVAIRLASPSTALYVHDILVTAYGTGTQDPYLNVSPSDLGGFCYAEGTGSSPAKNFNVSGMYLTENISIEVSENFEISLSPEDGYTNELTLEHVDGQVANTAIYVRMPAGLGGGAKQGTVTVNSSGLGEETVDLTGVVYGLPPEDCYFVNFEGKDETMVSYQYDDPDDNIVELSGIEWVMTEALIGSLDNDFKIDTKSARLRGYRTSEMTMLQDKTNGLGTLSFFYRAYGTDDQVDWKVEYSTDQGTTWIQVGTDFTAPKSDEVQEFKEDVNMTGNVRVRIIRHDATETSDSNKRLNIDNILMTNYFEYNQDELINISEFSTITFTGGNANNSTATMPDIPNPNITAGDYESLGLGLIGNGPWAIEIVSTFAHCAYNWQGGWHDATVGANGFEIGIAPIAKSSNNLFIVLSDDDPTLPVELSSFMVALNSNGTPVVTWETQTETGVNGFYIYRGENKNLNEALLISSLIQATNSSISQNYSFVDTELIEEGTYYYWLNVSDLNGHQSYHGPAELNFTFGEEEDIPEVVYNTSLTGIYPNPFNPNTNIGFELAEKSEVKISVYNSRGQLVRSFAPFTHDLGQGSIVWDGKDEGGSSVSSGIYLFRMTVGAKNYSAKALMIK